MPLDLVKAYANRTARLKLTRFNRLRAESQTIGLTCFLQLTRFPSDRLNAQDNTAIGPVATSHINFRGTLHFPMEQLGEPILRAPVKVPVAP